MPFEVSHLSSIGPFFGLATNLVMAILCLVTFIVYRHYRPLGRLFLFYVFLSFFFFGYVVYVLQRSPESILMGYRINLAALALLPASWVWFASSLFNEKMDSFSWAVTAMSLLLAALSLLGKSPWLLGLPLELHPAGGELLRPQSKLLRPSICLFGLLVCLYYFWLITIRLFRFKGKRPVYLLPFGIGLLLWFLGGLNDALLTAGMVTITKHKVLWFASFWLSISLTIAIALHYRALEKAVRDEFERLNKVKSKALDHLSHEITTPLAVIQGNIRILKRKLLTQTSFSEGRTFFESLEKHLNRLLEIREETNKIIRSYQEFERVYPHGEFNLHSPTSFQPVFLYSFAEETLEKVKQAASHRDIRFNLEGVKDQYIVINPKILEDILEGLLKNAIENTPDEGVVRILLEQKAQRLLLKVQDFGIGITEENQKYIFDGLFHTQETDLYTSKEPYDFNAGGKGLDLLRMKAYGQHLGFILSMESRRCIHLITDNNLCPGRISACPHCERLEDCLSSGGSTFYVSFPIGQRKRFKEFYLRQAMKRYFRGSVAIKAPTRNTFIAWEKLTVGVGKMGLEKLKYGEIRKQIKDGDILLYKGKGLFRSGFIATLVQIVTRSDYSHAGIAAWWNERLMVIEAIGSGVIANPLSLSLKRYHATVLWYSCKEEIPDEKRREMILYAQEELGKGFAVLLAFWFMIKILFIGRFSKRDRFHREKRYYCSEFVSNVYTRVGLDLKKEKSDRYMSPDDVADSPLLIRRGVLQR